MVNCKLCQAPITFSKQHKSARSGKMIPLDPVTNNPHDCPVWKKQSKSQSQSQSTQTQGRKYYPCRKGCGGMIYFDDTQKTEGGKWIPIDKDTQEPHNCE